MRQTTGIVSAARPPGTPVQTCYDIVIEQPSFSQTHFSKLHFWKQGAVEYHYFAR